MSITYRAFLMSLAICMSGLLSQVATATKESCRRCGCHMKKEHHEKLHLVCEFEEIEVPIYECAAKQVFCPQKGAIGHLNHRCETYCKTVKSKRHYEKCLLCKTKCGCNKDLGASPCGCLKDCPVRLPAATKKIRVPTFRWVAEDTHECETCHGCASDYEYPPAKEHGRHRADARH